MDALLTTDTKEDAANLCKLSVRQLHRYCADSTFSEELRIAREQQVEDAVNIVKRESKRLVRKLLEIADNNSNIVPFASQISAIRTALQFMGENDLREIRDKIAQLDRQHTIDQTPEWK